MFIWIELATRETFANNPRYSVDRSEIDLARYCWCHRHITKLSSTNSNWQLTTSANLCQLWGSVRSYTSAIQKVRTSQATVEILSFSGRICWRRPIEIATRETIGNNSRYVVDWSEIDSVRYCLFHRYITWVSKTDFK